MKRFYTVSNVHERDIRSLGRGIRDFCSEKTRYVVVGDVVRMRYEPRALGISLHSSWHERAPRLYFITVHSKMFVDVETTPFMLYSPNHYDLEDFPRALCPSNDLVARGEYTRQNAIMCALICRNHGNALITLHIPLLSCGNKNEQNLMHEKVLTAYDSIAKA